MQNKNLSAFMSSAAIAGNILFILWVTFNALKEGFIGTIYEKLSYVGLVCLLVLNSYLVLAASKQRQILNNK